MPSTDQPQPSRAFISPRAKIERANAHIHALETALAAMDDVSCDEIAVELYGPSDHKPSSLDGLTVRLSMQAPEQISTIVGDAIHNLRAALDLLACDLVTLNHQKTDNVYFPFCAHAGEIEEMIKRRKMTRAAPEVIALLRNLVIFPSATLCLRTLHDLDVIDKHMSLIGCICLMPEATFNGNSAFIRFDFTAVFHQLGQELTFLEGRDVAVTLKELSETVSGTVQAFASLYET